MPHLIADMNRVDLRFTVHDGDLKAGNSTPGSVTPTTCADALYTQALGYFKSLEAPAMFTTGDNDWTDCDRASNGGFNSRERLDHERHLFFSTNRSLGRHTIPMQVQSTPKCLGSPVPRRASRTGVDGGGGDLRHHERPGLVQQPLRHRAGPGGVRGAQHRGHRLGRPDLRRGEGPSLGGGDADQPGRPRLRRHRREPRTAAQPQHPGRDRRKPRRLPRPPHRGAPPDHRLPEAGGLRARRFPLLPHRQAAARRPGTPGRELHPVETRRPPGERHQTTPTG